MSFNENEFQRIQKGCYYKSQNIMKWRKVEHYSGKKDKAKE